MKLEKKLTTAQNAVYNTIGTLVYCFCQWLVSAVLVVHLSPESVSVSNTGVLQLAISITNIFHAISTYSVRTYQISDTQNRYSGGDYIGMRFITSAAAVLLCVCYILLFGYSLRNVLCIFCYMLYKLNEAFSDVLHGIDQKNYRMDIVGASYILRGIVPTVAFAVTIKATADILLSVVALALSSLAVVILYDFKATESFGSVKPVFNKKIIAELLISCFPAVISSAAFTAITTLPRQTLESIHGEEALGYYGTIATPLIVVQVMVLSIFNPILTDLAVQYNENRIKDFSKTIFKIVLLLVGIVAVVYICVALLGKFAVGVVFGEKFVEYTYLMYGIIGCTALYVVSMLLANIFIIMRRLQACMVISLLSLAVSALIAKPMINAFYMNGVSYCIITAYIFYIVFCAVIIARNLKRGVLSDNKGKQNKL